MGCILFVTITKKGKIIDLNDEEVKHRLWNHFKT